MNDRSDRRGSVDLIGGPLPGQPALLGAGLALGVLLLAVQLWLLTIALELFLGGHGDRVWSLALVSSLIFLGGLGMLWLLRRRPRMSAHTSSDARPQERAAFRAD